MEVDMSTVKSVKCEIGPTMEIAKGIFTKDRVRNNRRTSEMSDIFSTASDRKIISFA